VPVDVGLERLSHRATRERFEEDRGALARIADLYDAAIGRLGEEGEDVRVIDGGRSPDEVHADIVRLAAGILKPRYPGLAIRPGSPRKASVRPTVPTV